MADDMHDIKQESGETLKAYLARFNENTIRVWEPNQRTVVAAFVKGVRSGPFNESLELRQPTPMDEIRRRAECYINSEEANAVKKEREAKASENNSRVSTRPARQERQQAGRFQLSQRQLGNTYGDMRKRDWVGARSEDFTPLNAKPSDILKEVLHSNLLSHPARADRPLGPEREKWCHFHRAYGHDTDGCWTLMRQIERLIQEG